MKKQIVYSFLLVGILLQSCNSVSDQNIQNELLVVQHQNIEKSFLQTGWYHIVSDSNDFARKLNQTEDIYFIDPKPIIIKKHFDKIEVYETDYPNTDPKFQFGLLIQIHRNYDHLWAEGTEKAIGNRLALIIDNKLIFAPMVNARIESGVSALNGHYAIEELEKLKKQLEN